MSEISEGDEARLRQQAKALLRRRARGLRGSMSAEALGARCEAIRERLLALPELADARSVALFWPMVARKEVDLRPVDAALRARGVRVAYPRLEEERAHMSFRFVDDPTAMLPRSMPVPEPLETAPVASELDVVVTPGLLFDPRGYRIGYGGGYYDVALRAHCPPARAVGVCYDFQLAADLPDEPHDSAVHVVVTDTRVMQAER